MEFSRQLRGIELDITQWKPQPALESQRALAWETAIYAPSVQYVFQASLILCIHSFQIDDLYTHQRPDAMGFPPRDLGPLP